MLQNILYHKKFLNKKAPLIRDKQGKDKNQEGFIN